MGSAMCSAPPGRTHCNPSREWCAPGLGWGGFSESGPHGFKLIVRTNGKDLEVALEGEKDGQ